MNALEGRNHMTVTIEGTPQEIADAVLALQHQPDLTEDVRKIKSLLTGTSEIRYSALCGDSTLSELCNRKKHIRPGEMEALKGQEETQKK